MNFKILKRSLKSKKSINFILLLFVLLATMFIAGSINNLTIILGATDAYFDKARLGDYYMFSAMGGNKEESLESTVKLKEYLDSNSYVDSYASTHVFYAGTNQLELSDGREFKLSSAVVMDCNLNLQTYFDENDEVITEIPDGEIYLTRREYEDNELQIGDVIYYKLSNGEKIKLKIAGISKDAFLGAEMMGTHRFLISENDMNRIFENDPIINAIHCELFSITCNDLQAFEKDMGNQELAISWSCNRATLKTTYIMDMLIAGIVLVASILLVIVSMVILRFTILFTINEDYKEIGIMKAIGIGDTGIRKLYVIKYIILTLIGGCVGFLCSIPFSKILLQPVLKNMVVENGDSNIGLQLVLSIVVVVVVVLSAYISTGKVKRFTPMDAIRSGNNGERFHKKSIIKLSGSRWKTTSFLACNDVISELKKYMILMIASVIGVWMVVMLIHSINTLRSDNIGDWFGIRKADVVIGTDMTEVLARGEKNGFYEKLEEYQSLTKDMGYELTDGWIELGWGSFKLTYGDTTTKTLLYQGINSDTEKYVYDRGIAPKYENEIALTHVVAKRLGVDIGDTITATIGGKEQPFIVTAIYQSMNNLGEGARVSDLVDLDYQSITATFGYQYNFVGDYSEEEKEQMRKDMEISLSDCDVMTAQELLKGMIGGIAETLQPLKNAMLVIVMIINTLIVMLMQKMFILREKGEMAMLKSVGFSNGKIIAWQTKRIALVIFVGVLIGAITGTAFSELTVGQVFKFMGASKITFEINVLEIYVIYPLAIFMVSVFACVLTMLGVRKIGVNDMNEME